MTTGENAGTWGTNTNLNLNYLRDTLGYITVAMTADRTLTIPDNSTGTYDGRAFIIECTGALGANRVLDIAVQAGSGSSPGGAANILKPFIVYNNTSTSYTLTFKVTGATGFVLTQGSTYLCYHNGTDIVNSGLIGTATTDTLTNKSVDLGTNTLTGSLSEFNTALQSESFASLTGTETLTNKTLTSPAIGTEILDTNAKELFKLTATTDAVNEFTVANAATGNGPTLSATGETNVDINITPKATGKIALDGIKWPNADGTADQVMTTDGSGVLSFVDNTGGTDWQAVITADPANATAGEGYFCNTTSGAFTVTLPTSGTLGDEISFIDYAATFDSNNLTVGRNSHKIQGASADLTVAVERAAFTLVYVDATQGWLLKDK